MGFQQLSVLLVPKTYSCPCETLVLCVLHTREEEMPQQDVYSPQLTLEGAIASCSFPAVQTPVSNIKPSY